MEPAHAHALPSDEEIDIESAYAEDLSLPAFDDLAVAAAWVDDVSADRAAVHRVPSTSSGAPADTNRQLAALREEICDETGEPVEHNLAEGAAIFEANLAAVSAALHDDTSSSDADSDREPDSPGRVRLQGPTMHDEDDEEDREESVIPATKNEVISARLPIPKCDVVWVPASLDVRVVGRIISISYDRRQAAPHASAAPAPVPSAAALADAAHSVPEAAAYVTSDAPSQGGAMMDDVDSSQADGAPSARTASDTARLASAPGARLRHAAPDSGVIVCTIVIQAAGEGDAALDEGSLLCLPDRRALGRVEEVFGPVKLPLYVVRVSAVASLTDAAVATWAAREGVEGFVLGGAGAAASTTAADRAAGSSLVSADYGSDGEAGDAPAAAGPLDAPEAGVATEPSPEQLSEDPSHRPLSLVRPGDLSVGSPVCFAPTLARLVFAERVRAAFPRGTDASNLFDEEPGGDEDGEFSDDEAEAEARRTRKAAAAGGGGRHRPSDAAAALPPDMLAAGAASGVSEAALRGARRGRGRGGHRAGGDGGRGGGGARGAAAAGPPHSSDARLYGGMPPPWPGAGSAGIGMPPGPLAFGGAFPMMGMIPPPFMPAGVGVPPLGAPGGALPPPTPQQVQQQMHMQWQFMLQAQMMATMMQQQQQHRR